MIDYLRLYDLKIILIYVHNSTKDEQINNINIISTSSFKT